VNSGSGQGSDRTALHRDRLCRQVAFSAGFVIGTRSRNGKKSTKALTSLEVDQFTSRLDSLLLNVQFARIGESPRYRHHASRRRSRTRVRARDLEPLGGIIESLRAAA
jgi:hypothetical protein